MKARSDVSVRRVVFSVPIRFSSLVFWGAVVSRIKPHSTNSFTSTGLFPALGIDLISFILKVYLGNSLAAARTSEPNGGRRLRSYTS